MRVEDLYIIERFFDRDERAIEYSVKKYGAYCAAIAQRILGDRRDAEECVNDTWLRAWNAIPPERPACLRAFFGKLARNCAISKLHDKNRKKRGGGEVTLVLDELADCLADADGVETEVERRELVSDINAFLHTLSDRDRLIFVLRYFDTLPIRKVAAICGEHENYVRTILSRTREKLRKYLSEVCEHEK